MLALERNKIATLEKSKVEIFAKLFIHMAEYFYLEIIQALPKWYWHET